jgi:hypothetical protein
VHFISGSQSACNDGCVMDAVAIQKLHMTCHVGSHCRAMLDFSSNVSVSVGKQLYESIQSEAGSGPLPVPKSFDSTARLAAHGGSGPAWPRVIDASLAVATRAVSVNSKVSLTHDIWLCSQSNNTLFNVRLRTQHATDADVLVFPAHAAAADLAANCKFFERYSRPPRGAQYETSPEDALVIPIEIEQMYLHAAIRSLYHGSVQLSPNNVEGVYKAASCLGMPAVIAACKEYLLTDMISKNAVTYPEATYQAALLIHRHTPSMLADLWKTCAQLEWSAPGLQQVLDRVLTLEEACGVLRQKRQQGCACEAQVLECIKGVGSKRCALLHQLVDFGAMHSLEVQALMRFASAVLRGTSAASPASLASVKRRATSGTSGMVPGEAMPHSPSAGSTCSAMSTSTHASCGDRPGEDRFWATVLAGATAAHLDTSLAPQRGLHMCAELVSTIETGEPGQVLAACCCLCAAACVLLPVCCCLCAAACVLRTVVANCVCLLSSLMSTCLPGSHAAA